MNRGPLIFLGIFLAMASSFWGMILVPQLQIGSQQQTKIETTGQFYPATRPGFAARGAEVYRSLGCAECHTQQVRPRGQGSDFDRGWGQRRSVAQDYLGEYPVLLGSQRVGSDLSNIGAREPDSMAQLKRLWNPQAVKPGSMMPPHKFLFEERPLAPGKDPSLEALPFDGVKPDHELIATPDAQALVAYLLSLRSDTPLFEAPLPLPPPTNAAPADATATNAPAADTSTTNAAAGSPTK